MTEYNILLAVLPDLSTGSVDISSLCSQLLEVLRFNKSNFKFGVSGSLLTFTQTKGYSTSGVIIISKVFRGEVIQKSKCCREKEETSQISMNFLRKIFWKQDTIAIIITCCNGNCYFEHVD